MILRDDHYSIDEFFGEEEFDGYYYLDDSSMTTHDFAYQSNYDMDFSKYKKLPNIQIDGITYRSNSNIQEFLDKQREISEIEQESDYRILVVHQSFKEFCGFTGEKLSIEDINYSPYDVVICGHIHSRFDTILPNGTKFVQPGSIERMNTTEARDEENNGKGFYLLDTEENSLEFHKVECPRKFFLGDITIHTKEELENHLEELNNTISKMDISPIISYTYKSYIENIEGVREEIDIVKDNVLLNKSNIDDQAEEEIVLDLKENGIPKINELLVMYAEKKNFDKNESSLLIDLFNTLKEDDLENASSLLDNYFEKHKKKNDIELEDFDYEKDLEEYIEYFGG